MRLRYLAIMFLLFGLEGCSHKTISPFEPHPLFSPITLSETIPIRGMICNVRKSKELIVFIEGDGHAWLGRGIPSLDPTPKRATGWEIASSSAQSDIVYLSRPCHYLNDSQRALCTQDDWTNGRFSSRLIEIMEHTITKIKQQGNYQTLILCGYSGGGTMAMLIGARRNDVTKIITVASPLDIDQWCDHHGVTRLNRSLNPVDYIEKLEGIEQIHYVGKNDLIVPPRLNHEIRKRFSFSAPVKIVEVDRLDHRMEGFKIPFSN